MQIFRADPDICEGVFLSGDIGIESCAIPGDDQTEPPVIVESDVNSDSLTRRKFYEIREHILEQEPEFSPHLYRKGPDRQILGDIDRVTD